MPPDPPYACARPSIFTASALGRQRLLDDRECCLLVHCGEDRDCIEMSGSASALGQLRVH